MEVITKLKDPSFWRNNCLDSLYFLCRNVLQTLDDPTPGFKDLYRPTHGKLCDFLERYAKPGQKCLTLMPRAWIKSYIESCGWLIQHMLRTLVAGRRERWILNNATIPNAKEFLEKIKYNLQYNDFLRGLFQDVIPAEPASQAERWTQDSIQIKGFRIDTGSAEGNLVSLHYPGGGINDDLVNRENTRTLEQIQKVIDWWRLFQSLLLPDSTELILGTRWDEDDLYGYIMREVLGVPREQIGLPFLEWHKGNWHLFHMACWEDIANQKGSTFPNKFPDKRLRELIATQGDLSGGQYLLDPLSMTRGRIKTHWLKHWQMDELPRVVNTIMTIDPSGEAKKESDVTGMVVVDAGLDKKIYTRFAKGKLVTDSAMVEWMIEVACLYQPGLIGIEQNKFRTVCELIEYILPGMLRQMHPRRIPEASIEYAKLIPGLLIELKHHGRPKLVREEQLCGWFEQGLWLLPPTDYQDFRDELLRMGQTQKDNIIDAAAYILDHISFPHADDPVKYLEVPDELKMTDEERERKYWEEVIEQTSKDPRMRGFDDVAHLY